MLHDRLRPAPIRTTHAAAALFRPLLAGLSSERMCVAHLDRGFRLLHLTICPLGSDRSVRVPLRGILRDALEMEACAVILAHNHPGGDPAPSTADRRITRRIVELLRELDVEVFDHLVFAGTAVTSFRAAALL